MRRNAFQCRRPGRAPASCTANNAPRPGRASPEHPGWRWGHGHGRPLRPAGVLLVVGSPPPRFFGVLGLAAWPRGAALVVAGCRCRPPRRMASFPSQFWERWPRPYGAGGAQPGRERGCFAPSRGCPAAEHIKAPGRAPPSAPAGPHRARPHRGAARAVGTMGTGAGQCHGSVAAPSSGCRALQCGAEFPSGH